MSRSKSTAPPCRATHRLLVLAALAASCTVEGSFNPPSDEVCVPEPQDGAWDPVLLDWSDPGGPGDTPKAPPWKDIAPHHPYLTTVHAAHLPSGELILFHGQGEQRVWPIGAPASDIRWHPLPFEVPLNKCSYDTPPGDRCFADLFCAGHVVLPDGRFFVAGGNVTGSPSGGGIVGTYTFNAKGADPDVPMFGWAQHGDMAIDRWYPTLTVIPGASPQSDALGRVLISSGASLVPGGRNTFELFDPATGKVTQLAIQGDSPFTENSPIPLYPFIFLLPNGDIFYAGGESTLHVNGRVLIPDYNNNGTWAWHPHVFLSTISGGSAVMYAPGKIMKSGGLINGNADELAHAQTESISLSNRASGDYPFGLNFVPRGAMVRPRHLHTLTLLPTDGRGDGRQHAEQRPDRGSLVQRV